MSRKPWRDEFTKPVRNVRPLATHCSKGHEYTPENTYTTRKGRACIQCKRSMRLGLAYGITIEDKDRIAKGQGNQCGICGVDLAGQKQCLDHCHETGSIRGVLCNRCNSAEGHIRTTGLDPIEWAKCLSEYLQNPPANLKEAS